MVVREVVAEKKVATVGTARKLILQAQMSCHEGTTRKSNHSKSGKDHICQCRSRFRCIQKKLRSSHGRNVAQGRRIVEKREAAEAAS